MKKLIYALILPLVVVSGLLFANREIKNKTSPKPSPKPFFITDGKAGREDMKKWEASPEGKKVHASADKIRKNIKSFTNMEAVVNALSLPSGSLGDFGVMVSISGEAYIIQFSSQDLQQLHSLKINDKIIIRSHSVGYSPNYPYLII